MSQSGSRVILEAAGAIAAQAQVCGAQPETLVAHLDQAAKMRVPGQASE